MSNEEHYATISMPTRFDVLIPDTNGEEPSGNLYTLREGEYLIKGIRQDGQDNYLLIEDDSGVQWYVESGVVANPHATAPIRLPLSPNERATRLERKGSDD